MSLPKKCLVDTNVPKTANLAIRPDPNADIPTSDVLACIKAVEHVIKTRGLIIDAKDEIFNEYRQQLSMKGQLGIGDRFMKWIKDHFPIIILLKFEYEIVIKLLISKQKNKNSLLRDNYNMT